MEAIDRRKRIAQKCNVQFFQTLKSDKRIKVHQGGTRSGKTYAICQYLIYRMTSSSKPLTISIVRKTLPSLKGSVQRDLFEILDNLGILFVGQHNKSENTYTFGNHVIEFLSVDEPQKIRGRKRNICYCNEVNELDFEDFRQLLMRTTDEMICDFNPSDPVHWIYDEVITRDDCDTWITTYQDNKFLPTELVNEIERLRARDPDYWRIYGEGKRAVFSHRQIFQNWQFIPKSEFPEFDDVFYGLDFGFAQDPTAIVEIAKVNDKLYIHEICYKKGMTNRDIADFLKEKGINDQMIYCDSAEPKSIEELKQMDVLALPAIKGQGSILPGISLIKEHEVYVSHESKNLEKEFNSYFWEQLKDETIINKPIDKWNHLMDAIRYGVYSKYKNRTDFFVV
jgi:phage terminase large subunit